MCCSDNVLVPSVLTLFQKDFSTGPEIEDSVVSANDLSTDNIYVLRKERLFSRYEYQEKV